MNKITICHLPGGDESKAHTISIGMPAWKAHQKHGDYEGECITEMVKGLSDVKPEKQEGQEKGKKSRGKKK